MKGSGFRRNHRYSAPRLARYRPKQRRFLPRMGQPTVGGGITSDLAMEMVMTGIGDLGAVELTMTMLASVAEDTATTASLTMTMTMAAEVGVIRIVGRTAEHITPRTGATLEHDV